jgi:hypothetical protein
VATDDADLPFDPALALGPVGGQHVDVEVVVPGETRPAVAASRLIARTANGSRTRTT